MFSQSESEQKYTVNVNTATEKQVRLPIYNDGSKFSISFTHLFIRK